MNVALLHTGLALGSYWDGRLSDAWSEAEAALAISAVRGNRTGDPYAAGVLARIALHRGDRQAAEAVLVVAEERLAETGPALGIEMVFWARAVAEEQAGRAVPLDLSLIHI